MRAAVRVTEAHGVVFLYTPPGPPRSGVGSTEASLEAEARKPIPVPQAQDEERRRIWYVVVAVIVLAAAAVLYWVLTR